jgi:hypothetical protein
LFTAFVFLALAGAGITTHPASAQPNVSDKPNVVLSMGLNFLTPSGQPIGVSPGKYFVEPVGTTALRLTSTSDGKSVVVQAMPGRHDLYELFSPAAMSRPGMGETIYISLQLPGGIQLDAQGFRTPPAAAEQPVPHRNLPAQTTPFPARPDVDPPLVRPIYIPPKGTESGGRIIIGTRGGEAPGMDVWPLCPDHTGLTVHDQPVLFWYAGRSITVPIDVRLVQHGAASPSFEAQLLPPFDGGWHSIKLADYGIHLQPNVPYQWFVSLPEGGRDLVAGGTIKRVIPHESWSSDLLRIGKRDLPIVYAKNGYWYDALAAVSDLILAEPTDTGLREQRMELLKQGGLNEVVSAIRSKSTAPP